MKFDEILIHIGEFGTYQKRLYFLVCIPAMFAGIFTLISAFLMGIPDHRCAIPGLDNDTFAVQDEHHQMLINQSIPRSTEKDLVYDECQQFTVDGVIYDVTNQPVNASMTSCERWVYDKSVFESTVAQKLDLICGNSIYTSISKMLVFAGIFVGALGFGLLSDAIGRKKTFCLALVLLMGVSIGLPWIQTYPVYVTLRFFTGAAVMGVFMTGFVIGMEMVGPSKRLWAGIVIEYFFALGLIVLDGVAYFIRDWNYLQMALAFPTVLFLSYVWLIPESPRWLLSKGRFSEAEKIVRHAAKVNRADPLPEKLFDSIETDTTPKGKLSELFTSRVMLIRTSVIFFNWLVIAMVYYGLSLSTGSLGGDFYVNFLLSGLVEFPGYTLCLLLLDRWGRKKLHCFTMVLGGLACISTLFTTIYGGEELHALTVTLAMIGKLGISAAFAIIYVFSAELYPTVVRNSAMGASSCFARIGAMASPYIADLGHLVGGDFGTALPLLVFGSCSVLAGLLSLILPETLHTQLPETLEDARNFGKSTANKDEKDVYVQEIVMDENEIEQLAKLKQQMSSSQTTYTSKLM